MRLRITIASLGAGLLGASLVVVWASLSAGPTLPPGGASVIVSAGDSVAEIASRLESSGIVRSALLFRTWARLAGRDRALQPGTYRFVSAGDMGSVLQTLTAGIEPIEVTIPEGLTVREIAAVLATHGLGSAESFHCFASDPEFLLAAGVPGPQLEGYLFPDTYRFTSHMGPGEILEAMVHRFHERFDADRYHRAAGRHLSVNQIVTLASIIEKETGKPVERPVIAAVFTNRLRLGMPLQSDPTVIYAIPHFNGDLTRADLTRPSPYNTYVTGGLPPGPIANPGLAAIDAALAPVDSPALYFVSRNDGSHEFSATLAEHNRAVARYQRSTPR